MYPMRPQQGGIGVSGRYNPGQAYTEANTPAGTAINSFGGPRPSLSGALGAPAAQQQGGIGVAGRYNPGQAYTEANTPAGTAINSFGGHPAQQPPPAYPQPSLANSLGGQPELGGGNYGPNGAGPIQNRPVYGQQDGSYESGAVHTPAGMQSFFNGQYGVPQADKEDHAMAAANGLVRNPDGSYGYAPSAPASGGYGQLGTNGFGGPGQPQWQNTPAQRQQRQQMLQMIHGRQGQAFKRGRVMS